MEASRPLSLVRRKRTSVWDTEKTVLISIITSDKVLSSVFTILDPKLFSLDVGRRVVSWVIDYFEQYKKSPGISIQTIYQAEKENLKEEQQIMIAEFLQSISEAYVNDPPNEDYVIDLAVDFLRKQKIMQVAKEAQGLIEVGRPVADAEAALTKYRSFNKLNPRFKDPFSDMDFLNKVFESMEDPVYVPSGDLKKLLGPLRRGMLFGIMAPMKRGKTSFMISQAVQAVRQRRRVVFISLEMTTEQVAMRLYQHVGSFGQMSEDKEKVYEFPALDCKFNVDNSCKRSVRSCNVPQPEELYKEGQAYKPCSACRNDRRSSFKSAIYYVTEKRPSLRHLLARETIREFQYQFGSTFLRIIGYPAYSANLKTIHNDLDALETSGFIPDVIVIDYPDILAPEDHKKDAINQIDETWKTMKAMAQEKQVVVIAATQGSRGSFKKELIQAHDTPWDIRKLAHVDIMMCLNQTSYEKKEHIIRYNVIAHRWEDFIPNRVYSALQQMELCQPNLDGYIEFFIPSPTKK